MGRYIAGLGELAEQFVPSILTPNQISEIMAAINKHFIQMQYHKNLQIILQKVNVEFVLFILLLFLTH